MPSHCPLCPHGYLYDASGCSVEPHGEQFFDQWIQCNLCGHCWGSWSEVDADYPPQGEAEPAGPIDYLDELDFIANYCEGEY